MSALSPYPRVYLSVGDGMPATGDAINLRQLSGDRPTFFLRGSFDWRDGKGQGRLHIQGPDATWMQRRYDEIAGIFAHAGRAASPFGAGIRATIGVQLGPDQMLYLDVVDGDLDSSPQILGSGRDMLADLRFFTLPYARGEALTDAVTTTLTNGIGSVVFRDLIPGTAPALVRIELIDVSTGAVVLNHIRLAVFSERALYSAAGFPALVDSVQRSPGSDSAGGQPNTLGGKYTRVAVNGEWQDLADFPIAARGLFALLVRGRDAATASHLVISSITIDYSGGALPSGGFTYWVAALNVGGKVIAVSRPKVVSVPSANGANHQKTLTWTAVPGANDHRVYWKRDTNDTVYLATGSATASYTHTTESGATTGSPPVQADATLINSLLRVVTRHPNGAVVREHPPVSFAISNGLWEYVLPYIGSWPPLGRGESGLADSGIATVQARTPGTGTPNVDVDSVAVTPHGPGQYAEAWYRTGDLATKRTWVLDPDRTGKLRAYLADGSGVLQGPLDSTPDALTFQPAAGNVLVLAGDVAGGVSDAADLRYQVRLTIIPRYRALGGLPWT